MHVFRVTFKVKSHPAYMVQEKKILAEDEWYAKETIKENYPADDITFYTVEAITK